jgi:hypothetical protein
MILESIALADRKKLTSHYPVLLASETGSGKSMAFANLDAAEKKRTVIFNFDNKAISEDDSEFLHIYHSFDAKDIDMVDKVEADLYKAFASDKVDRVFLDTFTLMTKLFNRWAAEHFNGFDVWNAYNNSITKILEVIKSCTMTYGKFSYVSAHYPPKIGHAPDHKRYVTTKGKEHTNIIEESFSTVVETVMEDRQFYFEADVFDQTNTTKTKLVDGFFKIPRKSIDDLEQVINKRKHVVDGKLVEV